MNKRREWRSVPGLQVKIGNEVICFNKHFFAFLNSNLRGLVKGAFVTMVPLLNEPPL